MITKCIRPSTLGEALEVLSQQGNNGQLIAGGTDLMIEIRHHQYGKNTLIDISHLKELRFIEIGEQEISIGAGTRFSDIVNHQEMKAICKGLWEACKSVGSPQIRNAGTIGGNICNGSPAADSVPPLLALDAQVTIKSSKKTRTTALKDLYMDKGKIALEADELLHTIRFRKPQKGESISFEKLGLRRALAIARLSCAVFISLEEGDKIREVRIATGAMGRYPQREEGIERLLMGETLDEPLIEMGIQELSHIARLRLGSRRSAAFKCEAIQGLFDKALKRAAKEAKSHDFYSFNG
ncbi:carbon-monoxide dehydrogenase medium subunit/xanthine dehydrogenase FAD-binding subunit [Anaerosolibacter carboniphilus]|uniref:Carbon-monoxide dehydrogenase medium subunit/xanthine dehydrogenase FAD-binding subunit n=1 Tax=Anaerosolibacter carboniphilus TaxID=1417629 RepID=A0A841KYB4_9FIRM|nr:FAD binding domain-containing protein [Anaerosolibacter carboniphilus]MBB6215139.1 carbon-monoxide dehydrogenase medium subunit/xanthine dehydrogenase FAD-binding subunit [Anaerosolibacter carboniphilus]